MKSEFEILRECLSSNEAPTVTFPPEWPPTPGFDYALRRLLLAWRNNGSFGADEAVLLRQAVRWAPESKLFAGPIHEFVQRWFATVGLERFAGGQLIARPFCPKWLDEVCDSPPTARSLSESLMAEPFLASLHYERWRSPAQKEAAWSVLNAPPGATRIVVLPTGTGKSLCFQLLPRFDSGLTVVVVPTVALAIDQKNHAARLLADWPQVNPAYFAADEEPGLVVQQLKSRQTRMLFTSPESCVSGRIRPVLDELAEAGWLMNLVIDEAHLIETWGAQFRVEFQILSPCRRRWLALSHNRMRTFLFSATMTADCRALLTDMFAEDESSREFICQRTRPEMIYFHKQFFGDTDRDAALFDALHHLPRPAILYVTEVKEAQTHEKRLRNDLGFRRVGCFHGETRRHERRELLRAWQTNEIDLMVATSAFGVGVDKPDVRAVIHACYPESLDRYYQEVGRGGRDGWSFNCLLLPTAEDRHVAQTLTVKLMGAKKLQERWDAMFRESEHIASYRYRLPTNAKRTGLIGTFTYAENVRWNKRLLVQLHRAGLVELLDVNRRTESENQDPEEWAEVCVKFPPDAHDLGERASEMRHREVTNFRRGFNQLDKLLSGDRCVGRIVQKLYGMAPEQRACGGCPSCRQNGFPPEECPPLIFSEPPPSGQEGVSVANWPDPFQPAHRGDFFAFFDLLVTRKKFRRFLVPERHFEKLMALFCSQVASNSPDLYRLDPIRTSSDSGERLQIIGGEPSETLVIFHCGSICEPAIGLARRRKSVHLRCGFAIATDADGRDASVCEGYRLYHSPEAWLSAD